MTKLVFVIPINTLLKSLLLLLSVTDVIRKEFPQPRWKTNNYFTFYKSYLKYYFLFPPLETIDLILEPR